MLAAFSRAEVRPFRDAATIASVRALTRRMSMPISLPIKTPYSAARRAIRAAWALAIKALVGVQPVLTQVPPTRCRSTTATFIPARLGGMRAARRLGAIASILVEAAACAWPPQQTQRSDAADEIRNQRVKVG